MGPGVKSLLLLFIVSVSYAVAALAQTCQTPWKDCGSTGMEIVNVSVQNCCAIPCKMIKGMNASITVTFEPSK